MGYATESDVISILAKALTSYTPSTLSTKGPLLNIGTSLNTNQVSTSDIQYYMRLSDSHINAGCSQQYLVPFQPTCDFETTLAYDVDEYNTVFTLTSLGDLMPGQILMLINNINQEQSVIASIDGMNVSLVDPIFFTYTVVGTRVMRLKFPDPIPFISARMTAATLYEKYFSALSSPNTSDYFKTLNAQAIDELNNIREGRTILENAVRIGERFWNANLASRYGLAPMQVQDGTRSVPK